MVRKVKSKTKGAAGASEHSLPPLAVPTAEQIEMNDAVQAALRERAAFNADAGHGSISASDHRRFVTAQKMVEALRGNESELPRMYKEQLAEALATIGEYDEAYRISGNKYYLGVLQAAKNERCSCPDLVGDVFTDEAGKQTAVRRFPRVVPVSAVRIDGEWRRLMMCNECKRLTIE